MEGAPLCNTLSTEIVPHEVHNSPTKREADTTTHHGSGHSILYPMNRWNSFSSSSWGCQCPSSRTVRCASRLSTSIVTAAPP